MAPPFFKAELELKVEFVKFKQILISSYELFGTDSSVKSM